MLRDHCKGVGVGIAINEIDSPYDRILGLKSTLSRFRGYPC